LKIQRLWEQRFIIGRCPLSNVQIDFDINKLVAREQVLINKNQNKLDYQILKDSNRFCPNDVGTLQTSGKVDKPGEIVWDMSYAKKQYYEYPNKSKDKNANARMKWFEEAKSLFLKDWLKIAQGNI